MHPHKSVCAAGLAVVISAGLSLATVTPAFGSASVANPSFDAGWSARKLKCWNVSRTGVARFTVTKNANSGPRAAYVAGRGAPGATLRLTTDRTADCRIGVAAGRLYKLGLWQSSTAGVRPVVSTYSPSAGWKAWYTGRALPAGALRRYVVALPRVPAGVTAVSVGVAFRANSTVVLDDVSLTSAASPSPVGDRVLFRSRFPLNDRLVTNEFAYWSPNNEARVTSRDWHVTSGSLFSRDGSGYTGRLDSRSTDARSLRATNSAEFRMTTANRSFRNVAVQMNLKVAGQTSTSGSRTIWDGVHLWLRHQSQYHLYYASVARRDGQVVIKKKCPGGSSNGGRYYTISREVPGKPIPYGQWLRVGASVRNTGGGSVTIVLYRGGRAVVSAVDRGVGCAPITRPGATGIRADNTAFYFNDFTVTALG